MAKELVRGVMIDSLSECVIHKTVPKAQKSFRITSALLKNLCNKAEKIKKQARLVIIMQDGEKTYEVYALVVRNKRE